MKGKRENTLTEIKRLDLQQDNHRHQIHKTMNMSTEESQQKIDETQQGTIGVIENEIIFRARARKGPVRRRSYNKKKKL